MLLEHLHKKKKIKNTKVKKTPGGSGFIYQNELDKACFQHNMAYGDFKDLTWTTASGKIFRDKAFNVAQNPKYDRYQNRLASMIYKFLDKKTFGGAFKNENISKKELSEELHKVIIKSFKTRKVHSYFISNVWGADLGDMQLINIFNKEIRFSLRVINIFSKIFGM